MCKFPDCKITPSFNYKNEKKPLYCTEHKLDNMINLKNKTCIHKGCNIQPSFNYENEKKPLYCT
jgi:hypothetical protein